MLKLQARKKDGNSYTENMYVWCVKFSEGEAGFEHCRYALGLGWYDV